MKVLRLTLEKLLDAADYIAIAALVLMMFAGSSDGVSSLIFNRPIPGVAEVSALLMGIAVFGALPLTEKVDRHIKIDLFESFIPIPVRNVVRYLGWIGGAGMVGLYSWGVGMLAISSIHHWETTPGEVDIPVYPVKIIITALLTVATIQYLSKMIMREKLEK